MKKPENATDLVSTYFKWVAIIAFTWPFIGFILVFFFIILGENSPSPMIILLPYRYWWLSLLVIALVVWRKNIQYYFWTKKNDIIISSFDENKLELDIDEEQFFEEEFQYQNNEFIEFRNRLIKAEKDEKLIFNPDKWFIKNYVKENRINKKILNMYLDYSLDRLPDYSESAGKCSKNLIINRINRSSKINELQLAKEIKSKGKWDLLINFVKQNINSESEISNETECRKLSNLLKKYNIFADEVDLYIVLASIYGEIEYKKFRKKISLKKPKKVLDYIDLFLDIYGENYESYLCNLISILYEKNLLNQIGLIKPVIEKRKEELEIEMYEKKLIKSEIPKKKIDFISMSGHQFEFFLGDLFKKMGYKVINTKLSGDQGADLIIEKFKEKISVQAKNYSKPVSNSAVQEVVAAKNHYSCQKAMVVTTNHYTKGAISLAKSNNVELWDKKRLLKEIKKYF